MLQASSRAGLMKALGANNFKHDWFATSHDDLTPRALKAHLEHILSPPPLTASEAALAEVKAAEAEEAKRAAMDAETNKARRQAVIGLGGKTQWSDGVADALAKAAERSDDGWIVAVQIGKDAKTIELLTSEACKPEELAGKLPDKNPAYVFYSYPTPPPVAPPPAQPSAPAAAKNVFQATAGGKRLVETSNAPRYDEEEKDDADKSDEADKAAEKDEEQGEKPEDGDDLERKASKGSQDEQAEGGDEKEKEATPSVSNLTIDQPDRITRSPSPLPPSSSPSPAPSKGRVVFIYWCPPGSPVKFRMVYSTTVRGMQQDAQDKAGIALAGKLEASDRSDVSAKELKDSIASSTAASTGANTPAKSHSAGPAFPMPRTRVHGFGAPKPGSPAPIFGAPAPAGFGRAPQRSHTLDPNEDSAASERKADDDDDSKERIRNAFDAFGPRVGSGGGFARPRGPGRR